MRLVDGDGTYNIWEIVTRGIEFPPGGWVKYFSVPDIWFIEGWIADIFANQAGEWWIIPSMPGCIGMFEHLGPFATHEQAFMYMTLVGTKHQPPKPQLTL